MCLIKPNRFFHCSNISYMYNAFWSNLPPISSPPVSWLSYHHICLLTSRIFPTPTTKPIEFISCCLYAYGYQTIYWSIISLSGPTSLMKTDCFYHLSVDSSSLARNGISWSPPSSSLGFGLDWVWACYENNCELYVHLPWLLGSFHSLFCRYLQEEKVMYMSHLRLRIPQFLTFLYFGQLYV